MPILAGRQALTQAVQCSAASKPCGDLHVLLLEHQPACSSADRSVGSFFSACPCAHTQPPLKPTSLTDTPSSAASLLRQLPRVPQTTLPAGSPCVSSVKDGLLGCLRLLLLFPACRCVPGCQPEAERLSLIRQGHSIQRSRRVKRLCQRPAAHSDTTCLKQLGGQLSPLRLIRTAAMHTAYVQTGFCTMGSVAVVEEALERTSARGSPAPPTVGWSHWCGCRRRRCCRQLAGLF